MGGRPRVDHSRLVDDLHTQLTERFEQLTTSAEWFDYLSAARRFHRYSPQNQLLLALQGAEGHVAGYRNWQRIPARGGGTCQVAKGAVGLKILAPLKATTVDVDDTTGEETTVHRLRGFRTVNVFHQGQLVAPPDIGDAVMPELLTGENRWQHVWAGVVERLETDGYSVDLHTRTPVEHWNGMTAWATRSLLVADDLQPPQRLKTLLHEWAHVELAHDTRTDLPRDLKEVEAESVAYLLAQTVGLDSDAYSVPYIANWSTGDVEILEAAAEQILTTTKRLVTTLEAELGIDLTVDALDHMATDTVQVRPEPATPLPQVAPSTETVQETLPSLGPDPANSATPPPAGDGRFLKAVMVDLEPDQKTSLTTVIYDPTRAGQAATIIATAGRTAAQTARILDSVDFDPATIRDALLTPQDDEERPMLYPDTEVRAALLTITTADEVDTLMPSAPPRDDVVRQLRDDRLDDLRLIQRAIRHNDEPARIAALAYGLDVSPEQAIRVCAALDTPPQRTMAIAISLRDGDGPTAFNDLTNAWPDVAGGWEQHAHPSMRTRRRHLAAVPDNERTREILDQWAGVTPIRKSSGPEPAMP